MLYVIMNKIRTLNTNNTGVMTIGVENKYGLYIDGEKFDEKIPRIIGIDIAMGEDRTSYWYKGMKWDFYYQNNDNLNDVE